MMEKAKGKMFSCGRQGTYGLQRAVYSLEPLFQGIGYL